MIADQVDPGAALAMFSGAATAGPGFGGKYELPVHDAPCEFFAAQSFTGCVSDISSSRVQGEHFHADAFKRYAQVYEAYQAYLMPGDPLAAHDYELGSRAVPLCCQLGCLDENMVDATVHHDDISDEDIERCGYLGWLHH